MFGLIVCLFGLATVSWGLPAPPPGTVPFFIQFGGAWNTANPDPWLGSTSVYTTKGVTSSSADRYGIDDAAVTGVVMWQDVDGAWLKMYKNSAGRLTGKGFFKVRISDGAPTTTGWLSVSFVLNEQIRDDGVTSANIGFTGTWVILSGTGYCEDWTGSGDLKAVGTYKWALGGKNPEELNFPQDTTYPAFRQGMRLEGYVAKPELAPE